VFVLSGQQLTGVEWATVSPINHPFRTLIFFPPIVLFAYFSLHFLRKVNSGSTIIVCPARFLTTFQVLSGRHSLTRNQVKEGCIRSYNNPVASAFLGLSFFAAAEFLLILLFKQPIYYFQPI
jgi:hypothetical protein